MNAKRWADEFWTIRESQPDVWPTGIFVEQLLLPRLEPISTGNQRAGALIVYFSGESVTHSGVVGQELIRSKWGSAHTWDHCIFEVPTSFGSTVRYFKRMPLLDVAAAYVKFAM